MAYRKRTSPIWEFFEPTVTEVNGKDIKRVQCLLCTQQLADGGGTFNLMSHLRNISRSTRGVQMTLAKAVRHRVHSIASCGCVHWSTLPSSQSVLLSLSHGIFTLSVLLMGRASQGYSFEYFRNTPMGRFLGWSLLPS